MNTSILFIFAILILSINSEEISNLKETDPSSTYSGYMWKLKESTLTSGGSSISSWYNVVAVAVPDSDHILLYGYDGGYTWHNYYTLTPPSYVVNFGASVSMTPGSLASGTDGYCTSYGYGDGAYVCHICAVVCMHGEGGLFTYCHWILQASVGQFTTIVSISDDVLAVGVPGANQVLIYTYYGTWDLNTTLTRTSSSFGHTVAVSGMVVVVGDENKVLIYRYNGTKWNSEAILNGTEDSSGFGDIIAISGNYLFIGLPLSNQTLMYKYNGSFWNLDDTLNGTYGSAFGSSISVSSSYLAIGAPGSKEVFVYRLIGTKWILETVLTSLYYLFGSNVSVSQDYLSIKNSGYGTNQVFVYLRSPIPQGLIFNCTSLFSYFQCYWNQSEFPDLNYQIDYGFGWIDIQSPIQDGLVYYQQFNSSIYPNITGNEYYSIQIKGCNPISLQCGDPSLAYNLTTRIDSVQNLSLNPTNNSINVTWNFPNVQIIDGIPHLDHYKLSYFNSSQQFPTSIILVDNSSTSQILTDLGCETSYNVSIFACRTESCVGYDIGDTAKSAISTIFSQISNISCSILNVFDVNCSWESPFNCSIPLYYNFTYQANSQNDSGIYQQNLTIQNFTAQFPNQEYQINISACDSNNICGEIKTITIITDKLPSPSIYSSFSKIEEIELNFTKISKAQNYLISIDNETNWENFTTINSNGNEIIGIKSGLSGNIEYEVSIRACFDLNCENEFLGLISSSISIIPKLGNITSLICSSLINGFECNWDSLNLTEGLKGYSFNYNSTSICLSNSTTNYSNSNLNGGETYEISIYSSANENCSFNQYSGIPSSTLITTKFPSKSTSKSTSTTTIAVGVVVSVVVISLGIGLFFWIRKKTRIKKMVKETEKELQKTGGIQLYKIIKKTKMNTSILFIFAILILSINSEEISNLKETDPSYTYSGYMWKFIQSASSPSSSSISSWNNVVAVAVPDSDHILLYGYDGGYTWGSLASGTDGYCYSTGYGDGAYVCYICAVVCDSGGAGPFTDCHWILQASEGQFTTIVSISDDVLAVGVPGANQVLIYTYYGTWNLNTTLTRTSSSFGHTVAVSGMVVVVGDENQVLIYRYNGTKWNSEAILNGTEGSSGFGDVIAISGNYLFIGLPLSNQTLIYKYNGSFWNLDDTLNGTYGSAFGSSISVSSSFLVIGAPGSKEVFVYRLIGTKWILETVLTSSYPVFGNNVSVSENYIGIKTSGYGSQVFLYARSPIPQGLIFNCTGLFSYFQCYWNQSEFPDLNYQIDYGFGWIDIQSPIQDGLVYYQQFNSSIYPNITGNEYYSIQIKGCNPISLQCGDPSLAYNLTTRIDSVQNLSLNPTNNSINVTWNVPNVQIIDGIPHLDHYRIYYFNSSQQFPTSIISVDNSSTSQILTDLGCETSYNVSIFACRTESCGGYDIGDIARSAISTIFSQISNISCSILNVFDVNCSWESPFNCSIPLYYNFTYQANSQNDSGNYQQNLTIQNFTAQFPNQEYQINISACDSNNICGEIKTITIITDKLPSPSIYSSFSKIEEIELNFTKISKAQNYLISIDNETNWENFTTINSNGNEIIGIKSELSGNIEYEVSIRACFDLNCENEFLGLISSSISIIPKLGNITSLICSSLINGFECNWNSLNLTEGLKGYSFSYNSTSICLSNSTTNYSNSNLNGGETYEISIYSSANENCSFNQYSGIPSSTLITTKFPSKSTSKSTSTTTIAVGVVVSVVVISLGIGLFFWIRKKTRIKKMVKETEKELQQTGVIQVF
ncbi:hypothetical protein M0811_08293 [Anaeramoeba ignava]|uniref:Fibronectin type-III domain-containing protein n=1 Tax=Anaeramoeba ignava TaxID=1746090 RepID=A0A9Q0LJT6_ANAIG|nr:hypothetical protein M0811_08293 [Anaeramoeba ignava]